MESTNALKGGAGAGNDGNEGNSNNNASALQRLKLCYPVFFAEAEILGEAMRVAEELIARHLKLKNIWEIVSSKQAIYAKLKQERNQVYMKFKLKDVYWNTREHLFHNNIGSIFKLIDIIQTFQPLEILFKEFDTKLMNADKLRNVFFKEVWVYHNQLQESLCAVWTVKTLEDAHNIDIPPIDWIEAFPDPGHEFETLENEWNQMQLCAQMDSCLEHLNQLVVESGQFGESISDDDDDTNIGEDDSSESDDNLGSGQSSDDHVETSHSNGSGGGDDNHDHHAQDGDNNDHHIETTQRFENDASENSTHVGNEKFHFV